MQLAKKYCLCKIRSPKTVVEAEVLHCSGLYAVIRILEDPRAPELPAEKFTVAIAPPGKDFNIVADFDCLRSARAMYLWLCADLFEIEKETAFRDLALAICKFCKPGDKWGQRTFDKFRFGEKP